MKPSPSLAQRVFAALANGKYHSGNELAARFKVSRNAIWKAIEQLRALETGVESVARRGYRLPFPVSPLRAERITALLPTAVRRDLQRGRVVWQLPSTNSQLLAETSLSPGEWEYLLAEHQTAGRGRQARSWFAPPGGALCFSLAYCFRSLPPDAPALSLAIGTCLADALAKLGAQGLALKWPNDLLAAGGKLGGILIEIRAEAAGPALVVIGVGLNLALPAALKQRVASTGTEAADLRSAGCDLPRNQLAAALLGAVLSGVRRFERVGFAPFLGRWRALDSLHGKAVRVQEGPSVMHGHARGIDVHGALCVHGPTGLVRVRAGEVSVRAE